MARKVLIVAMLFALVGLMAFDVAPPREYTPVLLSREDLSRSVFNQAPQEYSSPGKIYVYNSLILIVDKYKGVHVINNSAPATPVKMGFIHIPGCMDVAVKEGVLFADNAVDLVSVDISTYPEITILDRVLNTFPEPTPPGMSYIPSEYSRWNRPRNTIIVGWENINN